MISRYTLNKIIYFIILLLFTVSLVSCISSSTTDLVLVLDSPIMVLEYLEDNRIILAADGQSLYRIKVDNDEYSVIDNTPIAGINDIALGQDGIIWLATDTGLASFDTASSHIRYLEYPILKDKRLSTVIIHEESLWVGIWGEGMVLLPLEDIVSNLLPTKLNTPTLINDGILYEELLWIGTFGDGVLIINPTNTEIVRWLTKNEGLHSNYVFDIAVRDSSMWIATYDGLLEISANTSYFHNSPDIPKAEMMYSVEIVDENVVLVGGAAGGPHVYCTKNHTWGNVNITSDPIYDFQISDNKVLIASSVGLYLLPVERMTHLCK